jgi:hypothetical protein
VPKRRGKRGSYQVGDATGDGVGTGETVTVSWDGLMATALIPAGTVIETLTVWVPMSREPTETLPTRVDVSRAFSAAVAPPRVTITLGADRV